MREHARLAGSGARQHQIVPGRSGNGLALGGVQVIEQMRDIHPRILREAGPGTRRSGKPTQERVLWEGLQPRQGFTEKAEWGLGTRIPEERQASSGSGVVVEGLQSRQGLPATCRD
ncbi:hypothetical protein GCM10009090_19430 [[Pseudomonas] boreopolis]|uniref:Uncharacterized protein n=1 Tax=Xanthomonas boreopolis TaxID=86183 RepID=A0A919KI68_9XANT|nr:hypothetical protein GCM10009090_19430 [[Pseudomonas] boreopolis]